MGKFKDTLGKKKRNIYSKLFLKNNFFLLMINFVQFQQVFKSRDTTRKSIPNNFFLLSSLSWTNNGRKIIRNRFPKEEILI